MMWIAWSVALLAGSYLVWWDFKAHKLPNKVVYPWFLVTLVLVSAESLLQGSWGQWTTAMLGSVSYFAVFLLLRLISAKSVGMGDVKLAAVLGMYLGWYSLWAVPVAIVISFLLGALYAMVGMAVRKLTLKSRIPFGPMMLVALPLTVLFVSQ